MKTPTTLEFGSAAPAPRTLITLAQAHTFCVLAEAGSVSRASARIGVGPSTISAHVKAIEDDLGRPVFERFQGGMPPTQAGMQAYGRLFPLLTRAAFCVDYLRGQHEVSPAMVNVRLPQNFAGTPVGRSFQAAAQQYRSRRPEACPIPCEGEDSPLAAPSVRVDYVSPPSTPDTRLLRDRWIIVRSGSNTGWRGEPVRAESLAGVEVLVPTLPDPLPAVVAAWAKQVGAHAQFRQISVASLLARSTKFNKFCAVVPAGLLPEAVASRPFEFAALEPMHFDPWLAVQGDDAPALTDLVRAELRKQLAATPELSADPPEATGGPETISIKHGRSFLALYEEGNVGRAAQRLCIVQPALTVQLHRIEEQLGCKLFERTHHGVRANSHGEALYGLLQPIIADFDSVMQTLRAVDALVSPRVRVGVMPALDDESLIAKGFAVALDRWTGTHPDSIVQVVEAYSKTLVRWLHAGEIDFAVIEQPINDAALSIDTLASDSLAVVVDEASALLPPGPVAFHRLPQLPLVLPSNRHGLRALLARHLHEQGLSVDPKLEVDSMAAALRLVMIAPYAAILPLGSVYRSRERRRLSVHEISEPRIVRQICLAHRREPCSLAALALMKELRAAFSHDASTVPRAGPATEARERTP